MTLKALKKILDNNFRPPFLPEGMVKTAYRKTRTGKVLLALTIGWRDVGFDRDGKLHDAGTSLCSPPNSVIDMTSPQSIKPTSQTRDSDASNLRP